MRKRDLTISELEFKIECLRSCYNLWHWLSRHPYESKYDYYTLPKSKTVFMNQHGHTQNVDKHSMCPACLFKRSFYPGDEYNAYFCAVDCIIDWSPGRSCIFKESPYHDWEAAEDILRRYHNTPGEVRKAIKDKKKYAATIAWRATKALKEAEHELYQRTHNR